MPSTADAPIVDAQVHTWIPDNPRCPWAPGYLQQLPAPLARKYVDGDHSTDALVRLMDAAGVERAILTSPWLYGPSPAYALESAAAHPGRFVVVAPFAPPVEGLDDRIRSFADHPEAAGVRVLLASPSQPARPVPTRFVDALMSGAAEHGLPVFVSPMGRLDEVARIADAFPEVSVVLDHCGLWLDAPVTARLALVDDVMALSSHPNVALKCSALPELSERPYPFDDVVCLIRRLIGEFGADRLMWGSDINQHLGQLTYGQSVDYVRTSPALSRDDKAWLLGGTALRVVRRARESRLPA